MPYNNLNFGLGETIDLLRESVARFAADEIAPRADEIDRTNAFPRELWRKMGDMGPVSYTHLTLPTTPYV